jgi:hypothetical protein
MYTENSVTEKKGGVNGIILTCAKYMIESLQDKCPGYTLTDIARDIGHTEEELIRLQRSKTTQYSPAMRAIRNKLGALWVAKKCYENV